MFYRNVQKRAGHLFFLYVYIHEFMLFYMF